MWLCGSIGLVFVGVCVAVPAAGGEGGVILGVSVIGEMLLAGIHGGCGELLGVGEVRGGMEVGF